VLCESCEPRVELWLAGKSAGERRLGTRRAGRLGARKVAEGLLAPVGMGRMVQSAALPRDAAPGTRVAGAAMAGPPEGRKGSVDKGRWWQHAFGRLPRSAASVIVMSEESALWRPSWRPPALWGCTGEGEASRTQGEDGSPDMPNGGHPDRGVWSARARGGCLAPAG
jgi:hypothetical protein